MPSPTVWIQKSICMKKVNWLNFSSKTVDYKKKYLKNNINIRIVCEQTVISGNKTSI